MSTLAEAGWVKLPLAAEPVAALAAAVQRIIMRTGAELHAETCALLRASGAARALAEANHYALAQLVGNWLFLVQRDFYYRVARPGRPEDNIGYHRDTDYGQGERELNVYVPLTPTDEGSSLRFATGTHLRPEILPAVERATGVERGSERHALGFRYLEKRYAEDMEMAAPCPKVGECVVFHPALIHGQVVNSSPAPRASIDFRIVSLHGLNPARADRYTAL